MKNKKTKKYRSLSALLTPDYVFDTYKDVTPDFLSSLNIKALLIDIDNTLAPYEQDVPDENIINWFAALKDAGISAALISNNNAERVELFNKDLGLPAYPDSGKPKSKYILEAIAAMGEDITQTAGLGDQLLTDTLAVHRLDMISIIVPPINDKKSLFFRFKRWLERPFMKRYRKLHTDKKKG